MFPMKKTKRHYAQYCPGNCGYQLDAASGFENRLPDVGDFSICLNCYAILRFGKGFKLELSSVEEAEEFELKPEIEKMITAAKLVRVQTALGFNQEF